jgi:parallel beta-helix repeat protein
MWLSDTLTGGTITVSNNTVVNPKGDELGISHWNENSTWQGRSVISGNNVYGGNIGIQVYDSPNSQVKDNTIQPSTGGIGIYVAGQAPPSGNISGNTVYAPGPTNNPPPPPDDGGTVTPPPPPPEVSSHTISLVLSGDAYRGDPRFTASLDGKQVQGSTRVTADHGQRTQTFNIVAQYAPGVHDFFVSYINDLTVSSSRDRNLYVQDVRVDGISMLGQEVALKTNGDFHLTIGDR